MIYWVEMAKLSVGDVLKLAQLSKLRLSEEELSRFSAELGEILKYIETLADVDTGGLEPTIQVTGLENVTRPDELIDYEASPDRLLSNVPSVEAGQIKVKRVIE